jgi:hypothetical protein
MIRPLYNLTLVLLGFSIASLGFSAQRPNIIVFLVDDLGQRDVGCWGSQFHETPAIDQLAKEDQMNNLAGSLPLAKTQATLRKKLFDHLKKTRDPRVTGGPVNWDHYPYYGVSYTKGWAVDPTPTSNIQSR